jgi:hypothetical protein
VKDHDEPSSAEEHVGSKEGGKLRGVETEKGEKRKKANLDELLLRARRSAFLLLLPRLLLPFATALPLRPHVLFLRRSGFEPESNSSIFALDGRAPFRFLEELRSNAVRMLQNRPCIVDRVTTARLLQANDEGTAAGGFGLVVAVTLRTVERGHVRFLVPDFNGDAPRRDEGFHDFEEEGFVGGKGRRRRRELDALWRSASAKQEERNERTEGEQGKERTGPLPMSTEENAVDPLAAASPA